MSDKAFDSWMKLLNPDQLKSNLIQCSLFLTGYEILRSLIIDYPKSFYTHGHKRDESTGELKVILSESYKTKVLALHPKDQFHASCLWFKDMGALTDDDLVIISAIRHHRNYVAHETSKILAEAIHAVNKGMVDNLIDITKKIEMWWIKEIEIPSNPDFDHKNIDDINWESTFGGSSFMLGLIMSIFEGDDQYLRGMHKIFSEVWKKKEG